MHPECTHVYTVPACQHDNTHEHTLHFPIVRDESVFSVINLLANDANLVIAVPVHSFLCGNM